MSPTIAMCPRCDRMFTQMASPVCYNCEPIEEADYKSIQIALDKSGEELSIEKVAEEAHVELACVMRMLDAGRIAQEGMASSVRCGRCGAPAISTRKRLCGACLGRLDQECTEAMKKMKPGRVRRGGRARSNVHEVLQEKRGRAPGGGNKPEP